jgi:hypothetical protein
MLYLPGVNVMITRFGDLWQCSAKRLAFFLKKQRYDPIFAQTREYFWTKTPNHFCTVFKNHNIYPWTASRLSLAYLGLLIKSCLKSQQGAKSSECVIIASQRKVKCVVSLMMTIAGNRQSHFLTSFSNCSTLFCVLCFVRLEFCWN